MKSRDIFDQEYSNHVHEGDVDEELKEEMERDYERAVERVGGDEEAGKQAGSRDQSESCDQSEARHDSSRDQSEARHDSSRDHLGPHDSMSIPDISPCSSTFKLHKNLNQWALQRNHAFSYSPRHNSFRCCRTDDSGNLCTFRIRTSIAQDGTASLNPRPAMFMYPIQNQDEDEIIPFSWLHNHSLDENELDAEQQQRLLDCEGNRKRQDPEHVYPWLPPQGIYDDEHKALEALNKSANGDLTKFYNFVRKKSTTRHKKGVVGDGVSGSGVSGNDVSRVLASVEQAGLDEDLTNRSLDDNEDENNTSSLTLSSTDYIEFACDRHYDPDTRKYPCKSVKCPAGINAVRQADGKWKLAYRTGHQEGHNHEPYETEDDCWSLRVKKRRRERQTKETER